MNVNNLINKIEMLNDLNNTYSKYIGNEYITLREKYSIENPIKLLEFLNQLKENNRNLKIGIIGRVKAGKSSLLNSLFFNGKDILPKAATPMTAALTIIKYGETFKAKCNFYSKEDIEDIENNSKEYDEQYNILFEKNIEKLKKIHKNEEKLKEVCENKTKSEMKKNIVLESAKDQYQRMMKEKSLLNEFKSTRKEYEELEKNSLEELQEVMKDYVGADGRYMPFTKSIEVYFPEEKLKGIEIIDTPGVNDPVISREQRTRILLKECDVTFVVSPSGQFLSEDDKGLMKRVSSNEGVNEIYIIASQVDRLFFGSEKDENGGNIDKIIESINSKLKIQVKEVATSLDNGYNSPFRKLKQTGNLLLTSGMCQSISDNLKKKETLDEEQEFNYNNLKKEYPNYFINEDENIKVLEKISNITEINDTLEIIKQKKDVILENRIKDYLNTQKDNLVEFIENLKEYIKDENKKLKTLNKADYENQIKVLDKINRKNELSITQVIKEENEKILNDLDSYFKNFTKKSKEFMLKEIDNKTEKNKVYKTEKKGFWESLKRGAGSLANEIGIGNDWGHDVEKVDEFDTFAFENKLNGYINEINYDLKMDINKIIKNFENNLSKKISFEVFTKNNEEISEIMLTKEELQIEIQEILKRNINKNKFLITLEIPDELKSQGIITDKRYREMYKDNLEIFLNITYKEYIDKINDYTENIKNIIDPKILIKEIFNEMNKDREEYIEKLENLDKTLKIYSDIIEKLDEIGEEISE